MILPFSYYAVPYFAVRVLKARSFNMITGLKSGIWQKASLTNLRDSAYGEIQGTPENDITLRNFPFPSQAGSCISTNSRNILIVNKEETGTQELPACTSIGKIATGCVQ